MERISCQVSLLLQNLYDYFSFILIELSLLQIFMQLYVTTLSCSFPHVPLLCKLILNVMVFTKLLGPHVAPFYVYGI